MPKKLFLFVLITLLFVSCSRDGRMETPLEKNKHRTLTSYEQLVEFVHKLDRRSEFIEADTLGISVEGRIIPYLKVSSGEFGADRTAKLMVLLFAQQHGDEPSGKEALLAFLRDVAGGKHTDLLEKMDLLVVPQVNPDGAERNQRTNADDVDLNRSHLILNAPETVALRDLFHTWEPYVTLDVHEYQPRTSSWLEHGYIKLFDEQFGFNTNLNTEETIRLLSEMDFLPFAERSITDAGYTFHNYLVGSPDRIRYSTTNINDGRQGFGILNTFSLILEGKNGLTPADDIERRTGAQLHAIETLLRFCVERGGDIHAIVRSARRNLLTGGERQFALTMARERTDTPLSIPVLEVHPVDDDYETGDTITVTIGNYFPRVVAVNTTTIPDAYIIPAAEERMIGLLDKHHVLMQVLQEGDVYRGEYYIIEDLSTIELEESELVFPRVRKESAVHIAAAGDVLVPTDQLRRLLIATALEPQSMHGLLQYNEFRQLRQTGRYPVLRIELPDIADSFR
jgi:hypothetical protein